MVKVLVTGTAGQVGSELVKLVPAPFEVVSYNSNDLDITNNHKVWQTVFEQSPEIIINATAYTAVDSAETNVDHAYAVNQLGVKNLAQAALALNIPIFHISTDYVFDGASTAPYKETDPVGPTSVYGASKLAGEQALADSGVKHIILRTSWVFGAEGNNFVKTMLRLAKERDTLGVVIDQHGCPTSAASIASVLWQLALKYIEENDLPWGVYHFSNAPVTTWHDFAYEIFKQAVEVGLLEKIPVVNAIKTSDLPTSANRPEWSALDSNKLKSVIKHTAWLWKTELTVMLRQLADAGDSKIKQ